MFHSRVNKKQKKFSSVPAYHENRPNHVKPPKGFVRVGSPNYYYCEHYRSFEPISKLVRFSITFSARALPVLGLPRVTSGIDKEKLPPLTDLCVPCTMILVFASSHSRIFETSNGDRHHETKCVKPAEHFPKRKGSTSLPKRASIRYVFFSRECRRFCLWITLSAMSDVKGSINDSRSRRGPHCR